MNLGGDAGWCTAMKALHTVKLCSWDRRSLWVSSLVLTAFYGAVVLVICLVVDVVGLLADFALT